MRFLARVLLSVGAKNEARQRSPALLLFVTLESDRLSSTTQSSERIRISTYCYCQVQVCRQCSAGGITLRCAEFVKGSVCLLQYQLFEVDTLATL